MVYQEYMNTPFRLEYDIAINLIMINFIHIIDLDVLIVNCKFLQPSLRWFQENTLC